MGDTGSLLLGLVNAILVIKFINLAQNPGTAVPLESAPAIGFAILMIPLFDTLRVFGLRILDRRSPFSPDRTHIHHFLLDLGLSHRMTTLICVGANILFIALAIVLRNLGTTTVMGILLLTALSFTGLIYLIRQKKRAVKVENNPEKELIKSHKVLTLVSDTVEVD
jgi:hypothetical protein